MSIKDFYKKVDKTRLNEALSSDDPKAMKKVANDAGFEISDEQLDYVAGGVNWWDNYDSDASE